MTRAAEPRERFVRLAATVRQQRQQVAHVVTEAREALVRFADREPLLLELRGIGAILHDFYTGIEHLFERIAPELNGGLPALPKPLWIRAGVAQDPEPAGPAARDLERCRGRPRAIPGLP